MRLTVISPPGEAALSLASAKAFLRIGHDGEDALVAELIDGASASLELNAGICLVDRTLRFVFEAWPRDLWLGGRMTLRPGPAHTLVAATLTLADGSTQDLSAAFRLKAGKLCRVAGSALPAMPAGASFEVDLVAGFGSAKNVPGDLLVALRAMLEMAYVRGSNEAIPAVAADIIAARREVRI
jgi:uncharacterized phiE125 gp8 family phage protein